MLDREIGGEAYRIEAKRLRNLSSGELADAIGALEARVEVLKAEAIRRELRHAEGEAYRIVCATAWLRGPAFRSFGSL